MKRLTFILCVAACALASCQKEMPSDDANGTKVTVTVGSDLTKTALGEKDGTSWPVLWQSGDKIDINGHESAPLTEGGDVTAEFSFEDQLTAPFKAAYPSSVMTGIGTGVLPAAHDYTAGSFDPDAGVLLGTGNESGVTFNHAMAYIAFVPQGDGATITSLELTSVGGEKLSGAFTTDYLTLTMSGEASDKVTVNCSTPVALGNEIIAAIPAQTYSQGFKLKFTDSEGGSMEKTAAGSFTAAAGHIYTTRLPYVADIVYPETLYMSGGFNGWSPVQMEKIGEGKFRVEDYEFDFFSSEEDVKGHGIKFFESTEDGWPGQWGPKENYETQNYRGWELASYGDAPQFYPLLAGFESGTYTVLVDFTTMTISLTPVEPEYPTSIRIYGPTFAWEWNNEAARCIINGENGIFEFSAAMYLDEDWKGFKFVDNTGGTPDWENKEYGMRADATADNIGFDLVKTIGGDPQFYLNPLGYESAIYTVRIDFTTMKLSLTRTHDIQEPFYVFGEGLDNDWATVDALALNEVEHNVFEGYDIHLYKTSSFKIVSNRESWVEYRRDVNAGDYWTLISDKDEPNDTRFIPGEADQNFKNGKYTVSVNLNTMKASLTLTEADAGEYPLSLYILGPAAVDAGWNLGNFIPMTMVSPGIFQAENVNISVGAAVDGDNKGNGFKFGISNTSWSTEYGAKEAFDDQDGTTGYRGWELAQNSNQFYPLLMGLTDGYYTITADFNTMTVSMTKE